MMSRKSNNIESSNTPKNNRLRWQGIFFILAGIVFLLQGLLYLNQRVTEYLLFALVGFYYLLFGRKWVEVQAEGPLRKIVLRLVIIFIGVVVGVFLVFLILIWIESWTDVPPAFLIAGAHAIIGSVMLVWSYAAPNEKSS